MGQAGFRDGRDGEAARFNAQRIRLRAAGGCRRQAGGQRGRPGDPPQNQHPIRRGPPIRVNPQTGAKFIRQPRGLREFFRHGRDRNGLAVQPTLPQSKTFRGGQQADFFRISAHGSDAPGGGWAVESRTINSASKRWIPATGLAARHCLQSGPPAADSRIGFFSISADRGQARADCGGKRQIVESDHRYIARDVQFQISQAGDQSRGEFVVFAKHGADAPPAGDGARAICMPLRNGLFSAQTGTAKTWRGMPACRHMAA